VQSDVTQTRFHNGSGGVPQAPTRLVESYLVIRPVPS
jgi:hypothetical protein